MRNVQHESATLRQQQLAFAACIRHPQKHNHIAGVTDERMAVYRDLFFNNFKETLASAFPVMHKVLSAQQLLQLVEEFFATHRCHTPYLSRMPQEFVTWLQQNRLNNPPWLAELAQWEWTELDLFLAPDIDSALATGNNVLADVPQLSPLVRLHHFNFAVHHIGSNNVPDAPAEQTVCLLAWRKPNDEIGFMELNALSARLLVLIQQDMQRTGQTLLSIVAAEYTEFDAHVIMQGGAGALASFHHNSIVFLKHQ